MHPERALSLALSSGPEGKPYLLAMAATPDRTMPSRGGARRWQDERADMRVLVIEDEVSLAEVVRRGLTREGFVVEVMHDGRDGL